MYIKQKLGIEEDKTVWVRGPSEGPSIFSGVAFAPPGPPLMMEAGTIIV